MLNSQARTRTGANLAGQWMIILLIALALLYVGQFEIFRGVSVADATGGFLVMGLGVLLLVTAFGNVLATEPDIPAVTSTAQPSRVKIRLKWLIYSLCATAYTCWRLAQANGYLAEYLIVWTAAIVTLGLAILPQGQNTASETSTDDRPFIRWEYILLIALFLGGLAVRTIALGQAPYLLDQDEATLSLAGVQVDYNSHFLSSPFEPGQFTMPILQSQLIGLSASLLGFTVFAARLPSAILGALTIPALYLLGREMFNRQVGLIAALFMLAWAYHVHFSRSGHPLAGDVLFSTLCCYFLLRGLRRRAVFSYFLSGTFLAIDQLFYLGSRVLPIAILVYFVYLFIRQRPLITKQWRLLGVFVVSAFLVAVPQNFWLLYHQYPLTNRFEDESILSGSLQQAVDQGQAVPFVANQLENAFGGLLVSTDAAWYGPASNLMGWIGGPLLVIGIFAAFAVFWTRPRWMLLFIWAVGVILGGAALQTSPGNYERMFPASGVFALLVGVGVWYVVLGFGKAIGNLNLSTKLIPTIGGLILVGNLAFFVFDFIPSRGYFANYQNWVTNRVADTMVAASQNGRYSVVVAGFSTNVLNTSVIQYLMFNQPYTYLDDNNSLNDGLSNNGTNQAIDYSKPLTFIIAPARALDVVTLENVFPTGRLSAFYLPEDRSLAYFIYEVDLPTF